MHESYDDFLRIAFIGTGTVGEAILSSLLATGLSQPQDLCVSDADPSRCEYMKQKYSVTVTNDNDGAPCGCRIGWGTCNHVVDDVCMESDSPRMAYYVDKPGRLVRELTLEQALEVVHKAEESGLVHFGKCWCCVHDCEFLWPMAREGRYDLVTPNRFLAVVNRELCTGCQECLARCPFNAIDMRKEPLGRKLKASVIADACKGCGVCITGCKQKAIKYEIVRPPEYITSRMPRQVPGQKPTSGPLTWGYYELK